MSITPDEIIRPEKKSVRELQAVRIAQKGPLSVPNHLKSHKSLFLLLFAFCVGSR